MSAANYKTMSVSIGPRAQQKFRRPKQTSELPAWVNNLIGRRRQAYSVDGFELTLTQGDAASLVSLVLPRARELDAAHLEQRTIQAYQHIRSLVETLSHKHPVRFWNALPDIHQRLDTSRDRYMVFNAGRFRSFSEWFGESGRFSSRLPAASAVGHDEDELSIHCLSLARPGLAVENPRQIPAFQYSSHYGPQPPCFARATLIAHPFFEKPVLVTAGTASVLGENSVHPNNLERQLSESLENLRTLVEQARGSGYPAAMLDAFVDLRVYHTRRADAALVEELIRRHIAPSTPLQVMRAELCRSNLLVEIEGIAPLDRSGPL
jgi:enamine deaminase RidA (YjgF/YER057c/UK114 family)